MKLEYIKIVKDNMAAFWAALFAPHANFYIVKNETACYTVSDIDDPLMNTVLSTNISANDISNAVSDIQSRYSERQLSFCWWVDSSTDNAMLAKELEKNHFELFGDISGMVMNLDATPMTLPPASDVDIMEVKESKELNDWIRPIQAGFVMSDVSAKQYLSLFEKIHTSANAPVHFVAKHQDKVIASSTLFLGEVAGIYNCATLPEYRGKGVLSQLTRYMLFKAKEKGYKQATLQASPMSVGVFRKQGFEDVVPYKLYLKKR